MSGNGQRPPVRPPTLVGETIVVLSVLHFSDGRASGTLHLAGNGSVNLLSRPKTIASMLHDHANELAGGIITPPSAGG